MSKSTLILGAAALLFAGSGVMLYKSLTAEQGVSADRLAALSREIAQGASDMTAPALAQRIIEARRNFDLVDVRDPKDFAAGHIEGARNVPAGRVLTARAEEGLGRRGEVILYDDGASGQAAQAALLLRAVGVEAKALRGGLAAWTSYTTDPNAPMPEAAGVSAAERQAVACYFSGDYLPQSGLPVQTVVAAYAPGLVAPLDTPTLGRPAPKLGEAAPGAAPPAPKPAGGGAFSAGQGC